LTYDEYILTFDWSDVAAISNLAITYGVKNVSGVDVFWFRLQRDSVSAGAHVSLDPAIIGTSTITTATQNPNQRKTFYASSRFWSFYSNGTDMVYRTSTDGSSWSSETSVRAVSAGFKFSVCYDGSFLYYAYCTATTDGQMYFRRGTPETDGTVTWSAAEQTAFSDVGKTVYTPSIAVDSNGYDRSIDRYY
jgi:hypothetical protein